MPKLSAKQRVLHEIKGTKVFEAIMTVYDHAWLMRRESYADHGEDVFVLEYFGRKTSGTYVDVGANHPFRVSNTYLLYRHGWSGITIEPITRLYKQHCRHRPRDIQLNCGVGSSPGSMKLFELTPGVMSTFEEAVALARIDSGQALLVETRDIEITTLKAVALKYLVGKTVDVLSVDTEGHDLDVLAGIDWEQFRPTLVICESFEDQRNAIDEYMQSHGYQVLKRLGYNTVYEAMNA